MALGSAFEKFNEMAGTAPPSFTRTVEVANDTVIGGGGGGGDGVPFTTTQSLTPKLFFARTRTR